VPVHIRRLTPEGEPIFFNKRLMDFYGLEDVTQFDKTGMSRLAAAIQSTVHPDDGERLLSMARASFASGEPFSLKYRMRRADGAYHWVDTRGEPLRNQSGSIVQWYVISLDIDDEMRAQGELRRTQERLASASQAASLAELSASIAHEVNQPLAAVVANSHACQRWLTADPPNLERAQTTVERIIRDANGAADVVARVRALFKQNVIARSGSSLSALIADAERSLSDLARRHGVSVDVRVDAGVPPVAIDQVQIQQVLINLMRNAMEAMAGSAGDRSLTLHVSRDDEAVRVEMRDTGPGLEDGEKIFDAFFTTKESGMGMGLAVSRSIVESHGGRLWAEQNKSGGATFIFTLPIEPSAAT
jgi:PAS domain S-box-containing protein